MKCAGRAGGALRVCVIVSVCGEGREGEGGGEVQMLLLFPQWPYVRGRLLPGFLLGRSHAQGHLVGTDWRR